MVKNYPAQDLFQFKPKLGNKYSLSEVNNPENYHRFIQSNPIWKRVYDAVKHEDFVHQILDVLAQHNVDLGFVGKVDVINDASAARSARWRSAIETFRFGVAKKKPLKTRFEFSMLPLMVVIFGHIPMAPTSTSRWSFPACPTTNGMRILAVVQQY